MAHGQSEENHKLLQMRHQADTVALCQGTNQPKVRTQHAKLAVQLTVPKQHIYTKYIEVTQKPGDEGWIRSSVALMGILFETKTYTGR